MTRALRKRAARERGMALPVMLIILVVMMVTSIYMLRSTHSAALTTGNLAYDATLSRAADYGLHVGFQKLHDTAQSSKTDLNADQTWGYVSSIDTTIGPDDKAFWTGYITVSGPDNNQIDYVIHRLCSVPGAYDSANNHCMQTAAATGALGTSVGVGDSMASDASQFAGQPQLHYVISARIHGSRGASVMNQLIVLIGT